MLPGRGARTRALLVCVAFSGALACSHPATAIKGFVPLGPWGSSDVGLVTTDNSANFRFLAGNCYGSYAGIAQPIPGGAFTMSGTFTQLMGAFPGKIEYAATFTGTVDGDRMTVTVAVPALQRSLGPYVLVHGVANAWAQCLYP